MNEADEANARIDIDRLQRAMEEVERQVIQAALDDPDRDPNSYSWSRQAAGWDQTKWRVSRSTGEGYAYCLGGIVALQDGAEWPDPDVGALVTARPDDGIDAFTWHFGSNESHVTDVRHRARRLLGLDYFEASGLFSSEMTLGELRAAVSDLVSQERIRRARSSAQTNEGTQQ